MWLEGGGGARRVEGLRLEEAEATGAALVATACPFCKIMLESAAATAGRAEAVRVRDVAEIVHDALRQP
jgi:Fe-S oxidoreductase